MKPHLIAVSLLSAPPLITPPPMPRLCRGFFPAPMALLQKGAGAGRLERRAVTNITNHLQVVNHIVLRVHLFHGRRGRGRGPEPGARNAAGIVTRTLDEALRTQLDRELLVMERGENVAPNQRRRVLLRKTLETRPARTIRHFYAAQMRVLSAAASPREDRGGFSGDIIHERTIRNSRTVYRQNNEQVIQIQQQSPPAAREIQQIADQVIRQLDRRMKLRQDSRGIW